MGTANKPLPNAVVWSPSYSRTPSLNRLPATLCRRLRPVKSLAVRVAAALTSTPKQSPEASSINDLTKVVLPHCRGPMRKTTGYPPALPSLCLRQDAETRCLSLVRMRKTSAHSSSSWRPIETLSASNQDSICVQSGFQLRPIDSATSSNRDYGTIESRFLSTGARTRRASNIFARTNANSTSTTPGVTECRIVDTIGPRATGGICRAIDSSMGGTRRWRRSPMLPVVSGIRARPRASSCFGTTTGRGSMNRLPEAVLSIRPRSSKAFDSRAVTGPATRPIAGHIVFSCPSGVIMFRHACRILLAARTPEPRRRGWKDRRWMRARSRVAIPRCKVRIAVVRKRPSRALRSRAHSSAPY